jgi:hypothetical protein
MGVGGGLALLIGMPLMIIGAQEVDPTSSTPAAALVLHPAGAHLDIRF